jgi:pyrroloquinoline quinone biosynthesis protein D
MLAPRVRLQIDAVSKEPVLLYPEGILELNDSAHEIVSRCDGLQTVSEIAEALAAEYETPREELLPDVLECLVDLQRRQLIVLA